MEQHGPETYFVVGDVRDTAFRPTFGPDNQTSRMIDVLLVAHNGQATQLNPNGN